MKSLFVPRFTSLVYLVYQKSKIKKKIRANL